MDQRAGIAQDRDGALEHLVRVNHRGEEARAAEGDACERPCGLEAGAVPWSERVFVVQSPGHAARQVAGLAKRLAHAEAKRAALTPARGRGKRQLTDAAPLVAAMAPVRKEQRGDGWLTVAWEQPVERHTHDVGRGRGSAKRAQRVREPIRSHMTRVVRQEGPIAALTARFGWQACVTNAAPERRSLADAVVCSRNASRIERVFNRLKRRVPIAPLLVTRDDHIEGLTSLLT